jgi:hypothetical protein
VKKFEPNVLVVRFGKRAETMLVEFANCPSDKEAILKFRSKWEPISHLRWEGDHKGFLDTQDLIRAVWEEKRKGIEGLQVMLNLGIEPAPRFADEGERLSPPPISVNWDRGQLHLNPRNLQDMIWLVLLQQSRRLGICVSRDNNCSTPYFLKYRPQQEFCSDACGQSRQRESKRRWWAEHGKEWQRNRQGKRRN